MPKFVVGGRPLTLTLEQVAEKMRGVEPEPVREHLVEVHRTVFPPKQVLATITGWDRSTFTTMEAQRVLNRVGLVCRRAGKRPDGTPAWVQLSGEETEKEAQVRPDADRIARLENDLLVAQAAIKGLHARLILLEA